MRLSIHLKAKCDNEFYVYISLSHKSRRVLIATPYTIGAEYVKNGKIINRAKYAEIYNNELMKYEEKLGRIVAPEVMDLASIKEMLTSKRKDDVTVVEFFSAAQDHIDKIAKTPARARTAAIYGYNLKVFREHIDRTKLYTFEMTRKMMQEYINDMAQKGKKPSTVQNNINGIRVLFYAVRDEFNDYDSGIINVKNDPFKKLELPHIIHSAGDKALSVEDIRKVINAELEKGKGYRLSVLNYALEYFLLSFYLLGINPTDMFNLKKSQYENGRITYTRSKTKRRKGGAEISIPVCPQAAELINKHKGRGELLLDMQDNYASVESVVSMVSRCLVQIYKQLKLEIPEDSFTWYSARHTWASIAANECHFSDAEVARALNHQSEHKVTRGYIRPDWSLLDRMNEAVLEVVNKKAETDDPASA